MYYRLTNFYQNNRKYVKSFDLNQLKGDPIIDPEGLTLDCKPLRENSQETFVIKDGQNVTIPVGSALIYPCGLIANSMFSDDLSNLTCIAGTIEGTSCSGNTIQYLFNTTGIAWANDNLRFRNSQLNSPNTDWTKVIPPPFWRRIPTWENGYNSSNFPDLSKFERFQVWMRTAGLSTFRKLYGQNLSEKLVAATWQIDIVDRFDASLFSGTKSVVISSISVIGGKNPFLGQAYITVGVICWIFGIILLLRHMIRPRKLGDHSYLSWNNPGK